MVSFFCNNSIDHVYMQIEEVFKIFNEKPNHNRVCLLKYGCILNTSVIAVFKKHVSNHCQFHTVLPS